MLAMARVVSILLMTISMAALLVMVMIVIVRHDDRSCNRGGNPSPDRGATFSYAFADCGTRRSAGTCADDRARFTAHGLTHRSARRAANGTTYDRTGLAFALGRYGSAYTSADCAADNSTGFSTYGLTDSRASRSPHAAANGSLDSAVLSHGLASYEEKGKSQNGKSHMSLFIVNGDYLTRMPGCAPTSGDRMNGPPRSSLAASTMPSDMPNFILRGAKLATITVKRPTSVAGS